MAKLKKHFDISKEINSKKIKWKLLIKKISLPNIKITIPDLSSLSFTKFSIKKQTFFAKRLSFLIKAGLPILESLHVIKKQSKLKSELNIFSKIISDVSNGQSLASSLAKFRGVFGSFAINIIKAGESSGNLTVNLSYLADELKKKDMLKRKIFSALLYPVIVTVATLSITGLLIVYIFPKILPIFQSLHAKLPLSTRIIIFVSETIRIYGGYIFLGFFSLFLLFFLLIKYVPRVKLIFHGLIFRIPFMGGIVKNYNLTNITRTLGLLLKSGISLSESLLITAGTTDNMQYKKALSEISTGVLKGKNVSEFMELRPIVFPDMLSHMIAIGEKSGNLSNTLIYLSEFYENEFDDLTKNLSSAIEPVLMIVMGVSVGFIAISVITPIYEITNNLKR
ncbi:MAG: type II secretion system F family protein [bacterium]|nr:type II secretion system F family protein [bacterium]